MTQSIGWLALMAAGVMEIVWALCLKYSDGLTRFWPTVAMLVAITLSFVSLGLALKTVPFGTAYAVWTGIGATGGILLGIVLFEEPADLIRLACLALIVAGIVGLRVLAPW